jgi:hypothetical protein
MKGSTIPVFPVELISLMLQISLFFLTVWFVPARVAAKRLQALPCVVIVPLVWFASSIALMFLDSLSGNDVPGIGYLFEGFVACMIGLAAFRYRAARRTGA